MLEMEIWVNQIIAKQRDFECFWSWEEKGWDACSRNENSFAK